MHAETETQNDWEPVDGTPGTAVLFSYANANHDHWRMLSECIDNAFDAKAQHIDFRLGRRTAKGREYIEISDDGVGCENVDLMVRFGGHKAHRTTRLGRYGIGLKEALFWWGGAAHDLAIVTTNGRTTTRLQARWGEVCRTGEWTSHIEKCRRPASDGERGTKILVRPLVRKTPEGKDWENLIARLGYTYAPALKTGLSIAFERDGERFAVPKWEPPVFSEQVSETVDVGGRVVRIFAGIVKDGEKNPKMGLTYWHGFRVILDNTKAGCGDYNISRVCGFVELLDGWVLAKNKDNITESTEELFAAVEKALTPLLEKAARATHTLEIESYRSRAEDLANAMLGHHPDSKAKREQTGAKDGAVEPKNTGRKCRNAKTLQPGSTISRARAAKCRIGIQFYDGAEEIGSGDLPGKSVNLNVRHPWVSQIRDNSVAIATLAVGIWAATLSLPNGEKGSFGGHAEDYLTRLGDLTAKSVAMNGATVLSLVKPAATVAT